jgi:hypothetical protein
VSDDNPIEQRALYRRQAGGYVATSATESTWSRQQIAGGAVLALFGHVLEDVPTPVDMCLSRLTADLFRAVPVGEVLTIQSSVIRSGKRIQVVEMILSVGDKEFARARALRLRDEDVRDAPGLPASTTTVDPAAALLPPDDERVIRVEGRAGVPRFLQEGAELRRSPRQDGGPHGIWLRLRCPVIQGEQVRTTSRLALATDFVNVIGVFNFNPKQVSTINPDVSAHLAREPSGEWIALTGDTYFAHEGGRGMSVAYLSDAQGVFGVASTCQLIQPL